MYWIKKNKVAYRVEVLFEITRSDKVDPVPSA